MIYPFFVLGTLWFWGLLCLSVIVITIILDSASSVSGDEGGGEHATIVVAFTLLVLYLFGEKNIIPALFYYIKANPTTVLLSVVAYVAIGTVWSIFKWYFVLLRIKDNLLHKKRNNNKIYESEFPKVENSKNKIISWMMYWPFSALWTLLNDPIKRMFDFMYMKFENVFEKISKNVLAELEQDVSETNKKS